MCRLAVLPSLVVLLLGLTVTPSLSLAAGADDNKDSDASDEGDKGDENDEEEDEAPPWATGDEDGDDGDGDGDNSSESGEASEGASGSQSAGRPARSTAGAVGGPRGGGPFGLGFAVGTINGLSLKIWPVEAHGIVINLGGSHLVNSMTASLSYRIHPPKIVIPGSPVSMHFNLGPMFRARMVFYGNGTYTELGGGAAIGMSITVADAPVEVFMEVAPAFVGGVGPANVGIGFDVGGRVGVRFYPG